MCSPADGTLNATDSGSILSKSTGSRITGPSETAMAASRCSMLLLLLAVALTAFASLDRTDAQSAPAPVDSACLAPFQELGPCLDFASGAATSPSAQCCSGLKDVASNHVECLCELLANPGQFKINLTLALQLPALCQVPVSPSACAPASTPPAASPHTPPTPRTPSTPPIPATPAPPIPAAPVQSPSASFLPAPGPAPSGSSTPRATAMGSFLAVAAVTLAAAALM